MSIKINIKKNLNENKIKNYILFSDENFRIKGLEKLLLKKYSSVINKSIINNIIKDKNFLLFNINPNQKIILIKIKNNQFSIENEKIGAEFYDFVKSNSIFSSTFIDNNIKDFTNKNKNFLD